MKRELRSKSGISSSFFLANIFYREIRSKHIPANLFLHFFVRGQATGWSLPIACDRLIFTPIFMPQHLFFGEIKSSESSLQKNDIKIEFNTVRAGIKASDESFLFCLILFLHVSIRREMRIYPLKIRLFTKSLLLLRQIREVCPYRDD